MRSTGGGRATRALRPLRSDGACGSLGIADRWADLAIATWSTDWNFGPAWESVVLDAFGIDPDPSRTAFYRLLRDVGE